MTKTKELLEEIKKTQAEIEQSRAVIENVKNNLQSHTTANKFLMLSLPILGIAAGWFISRYPIKKIANFAMKSQVINAVRHFL